MIDYLVEHHTRIEVTTESLATEDKRLHVAAEIGVREFVLNLRRRYEKQAAKKHVAKKRGV